MGQNEKERKGETETPKPYRTWMDKLPVILPRRGQDGKIYPAKTPVVAPVPVSSAVGTPGLQQSAQQGVSAAQRSALLRCAVQLERSEVGLRG